MVFNSFNFWLIFPFIFILYWGIPSKFNRVRNGFLLLVSYLLYMNWKPAFALVLAGVTLITYMGGVLCNSNGSRKKNLCWCFAIIGLLPLLVFKYYNFLNDSMTGVLETCGLHFALPGLNWAIPVGISFFTFQAVGYLLDVYHQRVPAEMNFWDYALFVSFFPQVTSGPISTAKDLMPQIKASHAFCYEQGRDGLQMLLWGMFCKLVIADRLGMFVDTVYANYEHYSGNTCLVASIFYTIQIYCDFAGYSLMAIGIAKTLGFDLINNFERPYLAASVTEFWKRWHISLTQWLTTHVYINLGGNRCSKMRQYMNIMITFLVSGVWHGSNWTFIVWGALHGLFQIVEKTLMGDKLKVEMKQGRAKMTAIRLVRIFITFNLVSFAWIFFKMPTLNMAFSIIKKMFIDKGTVDLAGTYNGSAPILILVLSIPLLLLKDISDETGLFARIRKFASIRWFCYVLLFILILSLGVLDGGQFIYVSF